MGEGWQEWRRKFSREIILILAGVLLVGCGIFWWKSQASGPVPELEVITANEPTSSDKPAQVWVIDVAGGVVNPGVYSLSVGSRVEDAIVAAGGISETADEEKLHLAINRAERLRDGQKVYIPVKGRENNTGQTEVVSGDRVDVNSATQTQLESLPGIGPVTAQKIMAGRPYGEISELVGKKIIGQKLFDELTDKLAAW